MQVFKTRQSTINRYVDFLNSFVEEEHLPVNERTKVSVKSKHFGVSASAAHLASEVGLLKKIAYGNYEPVKKKYNESDAKNLCQHVSNAIRISLIKDEKKPLTLTVKTKTVKPKEVGFKVVEPKTVKEPKQKHVFNPVKLRVFSLFWGLIKFNY